MEGNVQLPIQWVPGALSQGLHEADQSPLSSAEVRNAGSIPPFRHMSPWHSA
jgi:hypothetical protein